MSPEEAGETAGASSGRGVEEKQKYRTESSLFLELAYAMSERVERAACVVLFSYEVYT